MANISNMFDQALRHHQSGNLHEAETLYRQVIQIDSWHADAHHLLGLIGHQTGHHEAAIPLLRQAINLNPSVAAYHSNLGVVLKAVGQGQEARTCFERAVKLNPRFADAFNNLGNILQEQRQFAEAIQCYQKALQSNPGNANVHYHLGNALKEMGRLEEAVASYREVLRINPRHLDALNNLGVALKNQGKLEEAVACYQQVLQLNPEHANAHLNIGNVLKSQGQLADAVRYYRQAVRISPSQAEAHGNLGMVLKDLGQLAEAEQSCREALRLNPNYAEAHNNLGIILREQGDLDQALHCHEQALVLKPEFSSARWNRSLLLLQKGDFERGLPEFEFRKQHPEFAPVHTDKPFWDGASLNGKTILLTAEQGLGDTIQFIRYAPMVKQRGGTVLLECQPALAELLQTVAGVDQVIPQGQELPEFDVQVPLLSLPAIFHTTLATIPKDVPYLRADVGLVQGWRGELGTGGRFKIGIIWQGNPEQGDDRYRSVPLYQFAPLARVPGVDLLSLQVGPGSDQLSAVTFPVMDLGSQFNRNSLQDLAAVLCNLDLVVTVCTSVAHLAGALAVPVWVALRSVPHWCWFLDREDSPFYPTMRLFRQQRHGDWGGVFEMMAAALARRLGAE